MDQKLEHKNKLLHDFFIDGGQVKMSVRSGDLVTLPDDWHDTYPYEEWAQLKESILHMVKSLDGFSEISPIDAAQDLRMSYRDVLELVRMQRLGTIKEGKFLKIYRPSIDHYLQQSLREPIWANF